MKNRRIKTKNYILPDSVKKTELEKKISSFFQLSNPQTSVKNLLYFDTFDWRLFNKGLLVVKEGDHCSLVELDTENLLATIDIKLKTRPVFWWDIPESIFRDKIKPIIDIRALMPILSLNKNIKSFGVLNKDEKTIAKINFETNKIYEEKKVLSEEHLIVLKPIRGYKDEFGLVEQFFSKTGIKVLSENFIEYSLRLFDREPGKYSNKINVDLKTDMTSLDATKKLLLSLVQTIKKNQDGVINDVDTEFLHDFRVAIRRTRSALSQIKGVLPDNILKRFKQDFALAGKATNRLRDLDVYLLEEEYYKKLLPPDLQSGITTVFKKLAVERQSEQKKIVKFLRGNQYNKIIKDWEDYLQSPSEQNSSAKKSDLPVIVLAKKFIWKKYKQILNKGNKINDLTPDAELHQLRIECKKLRYLLEFFNSLFPKNQMDIILKQLKKLQDNLGDFNDLYVQQESLKDFLGKQNNGKDLQQITLSVGGLVAVLSQKQIKVRNAFSDTFDNFSSHQNIDLYRQLFFNKLEGNS